MENTNSMTVIDLARMKNIIEIACERGAFRASEMKIIGDVYDRLVAFLGSVASDASVEHTSPDQSNPQGESQ